MAVRRPWIAGLRAVPGSARLIGLRWLLFILAALPGLAAATGGFSDGIADRPYFAEAPDPLPMVPLIRLMDQMPGTVWGALALGAVVAWLGNLLLTAGAVTLFGTVREGRPRVWQTVFAAGARSLWAYLRIALLALLLAALGARLIGLVGERLADHGQQAYWTMQARILVQAGRALATLGWLTLVGVFAWWCRVIVVADERRRVRRLLGVVPRLWWRKPVGALLLQFLLAAAGLVSGAAALVAWRQSPAGGTGWALAWLALLWLLSFVWHWRLRAGRLLWSSPDLVDLRALPDAPWGLGGRLAARLKPRRAAAPPPAEPSDA